MDTMKVTVEHDGVKWTGTLTQVEAAQKYNRFWPKGVWPWLYPGDKYWPLMEKTGIHFGGMQFWSIKTDPRKRPWARDSVPYICEVQTKEGRSWDDADSSEFQRIISLHAQSPACFGFNVNCEVAWTQRTVDAVDVIQDITLAGVYIFTGPLRHDPKENGLGLGDYDMFDSILSWVNCWHRDRSGNIGDDFPEGDLWYLLADAARWEVPIAISVQPCRLEGNPETGAPIILPPVEKFHRVLQCAANYADGLFCWKFEQLMMAKAGELPCEGDLNGILAALRDVRQKPLYREPLPVSFRATNSDGFNRARVLCRAVARAGYYPKNEPGGGRLSFTDLPWTAEDEWIFDRFHHAKHADADGTEGERLAEIERRLADWVRAQFGTPAAPIVMEE